MVDFQYKSAYTVEDLRKIVKVLRGEGGCPWDREQTHSSMRRAMLEESYEVVEAIDEASAEHLREELGDVLLQVVFHADIEEDAGRFDLDGVADGIVKKLILRHPHVFGDVAVEDSAEVLRNWDAIKRKEKHQETTSDALEAVARSLPALWRAEKIQKKAVKAGYPLPDAPGTEVPSGEDAKAPEVKAPEALGDALFALVNAARLRKLDPEALLNGASDRFIQRFAQWESERGSADKN